MMIIGYNKVSQCISLRLLSRQEKMMIIGYNNVLANSRWKTFKWVCLVRFHLLKLPAGGSK